MSFIVRHALEKLGNRFGIKKPWLNRGGFFICLFGSILFAKHLNSSREDYVSLLNVK